MLRRRLELDQVRLNTNFKIASSLITLRLALLIIKFLALHIDLATKLK